MQQTKKLKTSRRLLSHGLLCASTAFTCVALHADHEKATNEKDLSFLKEVAQGGKMEVEMGRLGSQKGQSAEVKQFSERLVNDHTKANDELMQLAQQKGITLDGASGHKDNTVMDQFSTKSGADFDKAFTKHMIKDHKKDIAKFEKEAAQTSDPDVKAFVNKTLPTLREHLQNAQSIARTLGLDEKSITLNEDNYTVDPVANAGAAVNIQTDNRAATEQRIVTSTAIEPRANIDVNSDATRSDRTYINNTPTSADTGVSASASTDTSKPHRKFLGMTTDKNDGKLLGIIPWHRRHSVDTDTSAVGAPPSVTTENNSSDRTAVDRDATDHHLLAKRLGYNDVPKAVQDTITAQGGTTSLKNIKQETEQGKTVYCVDISRHGEKVKLRINEDGTIADSKIK